MANKHTIIGWRPSYSVGIRLVDEQHKELINLTNKLFVNCLGGQERTRDTFLKVIHEAVDYVGYHFGTEEKVMGRVRYPDLPNHKRQHEAFVREVFSKVEDFNKKKLMAPLQFVYFLRDWVLDHIAVSDKKMGDYLLYLQRSGELQKITLRVRKDEMTNRLQIM